MDKVQRLHNFWSGFGIPAYDANDVPVKAQLPYITYDVSTDDFGNQRILNASLWYRSTRWDEITQKAQQIADTITRGGLMLKYDNGAIWLRRGNPWAQRMGDPSDSMIRLIVLTVYVEYLD